MPKFLFTATYNKPGIEGLMREGGSARAKAIQMVAESTGGTLESLYWAFGETDVYLIVDLPDAISAGAISAKVALSGAVNICTTPLVTAEEMDAIAAKAKDIEYRPPGG